jgi:hypothetical protein
LGLEVEQHGAQEEPHAGIERAVGFVEQVEVDVGHQRGNQREFLLHAGAVTAHLLREWQLETREQPVVEALLSPRIETQREVEERFARHLLVDAGFPGQVAGVAADRQRVVVGVAAEHRDLACIARDEPDERAQQRRLASPVGADEAEQFAARHLEVDAAQHVARAKRLLQARDRDGVHATSARKFCSRREPSGVRNDSGWNCTPKVGWSRWRSAITSP